MDYFGCPDTDSSSKDECTEEHIEVNPSTISSMGIPRHPSWRQVNKQASCNSFPASTYQGEKEDDYEKNYPFRSKAIISKKKIRLPLLEKNSDGRYVPIGKRKSVRFSSPLTEPKVSTSSNKRDISFLFDEQTENEVPDSASPILFQEMNANAKEEAFNRMQIVSPYNIDEASSNNEVNDEYLTCLDNVSEFFDIEGSSIYSDLVDGVFKENVTSPSCDTPLDQLEEGTEVSKDDFFKCIEKTLKNLKACTSAAETEEPVVDKSLTLVDLFALLEKKSGESFQTYATMKESFEDIVRDQVNKLLSLEEERETLEECLKSKTKELFASVKEKNALSEKLKNSNLSEEELQKILAKLKEEETSGTILKMRLEELAQSKMTLQKDAESLLERWSDDLEMSLEFEDGSDLLQKLHVFGCSLMNIINLERQKSISLQEKERCLEETITETAAKLQECEEKEAQLRDENNQKSKEIESTWRKYEEQKDYSEELSLNLEEALNCLEHVETQLGKKKEHLSKEIKLSKALTGQLQEATEEVSQLNKQLGERLGEISALETRFEEEETKNQQKDLQLAAKSALIEKMETTAQQSLESIKELQTKLAQEQEKMIRLETQNSEILSECNAMKAALGFKESRIEFFEKDFVDNKAKIAELEKVLKESSEHMFSLQESVVNLQSQLELKNNAMFLQKQKSNELQDMLLYNFKDILTIASNQLHDYLDSEYVNQILDSLEIGMKATVPQAMSPYFANANKVVEQALVFMLSQYTKTKAELDNELKKKSLLKGTIDKQKCELDSLHKTLQAIVAATTDRPISRTRAQKSSRRVVSERGPYYSKSNKVSHSGSLAKPAIAVDKDIKVKSCVKKSNFQEGM